MHSLWVNNFLFFFPHFLWGFGLDTSSDTGNHELSRILHGVDTIILTTLFCQKSTGLAQSLSLGGRGGGSLKSPWISVQVIEESLNFLNFECSGLKSVF